MINGVDRRKCSWAVSSRQPTYLALLPILDVLVAYDHRKLALFGLIRIKSASGSRSRASSNSRRAAAQSFRLAASAGEGVRKGAAAGSATVSQTSTSEPWWLTDAVPVIGPN